MLINRDNLSQHTPWIVGCLAVAVISTIWYFAAYFGSGGWDARPSGSSLPGFTFGTIGGLICLFEFLLWPRKHYRAWRLGRVQVWMRAHIWLGLLAVPLLVLHTGFRWGGSLSTVLMILFLAVIASGVWGLVVQQFLPARMFENVPAETIYSQIDRVVGQLIWEADRLVLATCGPEVGASGFSPQEREDLALAGTGHVVVGAFRSAGRVQGRVLETRTSAAPVPESEYLRAFYVKVARPYLDKGSKIASPLRVKTGSLGAFEDARTHVPPAAHVALNTLKELCDQRYQLDTQIRIHHWLHNWLWVHVPLSVALIVLMFVHVFVAIKYW